MLVSGGQGIMRVEVMYGVSRIAHVVHFCCVRCCSFIAANRLVVSTSSLFAAPSPSKHPLDSFWVVAALRVAVEARVRC